MSMFNPQSLPAGRQNTILQHFQRSLVDLEGKFDRRQHAGDAQTRALSNEDEGGHQSTKKRGLSIEILLNPEQKAAT